MSRTDKDQPYQRHGRRGRSTPSWWHKMLRRRHRSHARQDLRNGREPAAQYRDDREWYW